MPIYEFRCQHCGKEMDFWMKLADPLPTICKFCEQGPLTKLISQTSFVLKGTGWYETDFKNPKKPASKAEKKASDAKADVDPVVAGADCVPDMPTAAADPTPETPKKPA
jgi:putative FmdB family regulatory protein